MDKIKYLYQIDHYDAYNFLIIGPISFLASFFFILLNIYFKEIRKFPGNLLIIISAAEMVLCAHWIVSGIYTKFIIGSREIAENSLFCVLNSHVTVFAASVEYWFQLAFLVSVIRMFKNTMKEIKHTMAFIIIPLALSILSWYFAVHMKTLGKNIYGTCSVNNLEKPITIFSLIPIIYLVVAVYTLKTLYQFEEQNKNEIIKKTRFISFYVNYTVLIFCMYLVIILNFTIGKFITDAVKTMNYNDAHYNVIMQWYYISRLFNNFKVYIPFMTFLLRINDPFIEKLIYRFLYSETNASNAKPTNNETMIDDDKEETDDFAVNSHKKEIRMRMVKSIVKGLRDYFTRLRFQYDKIENETLLNQLKHEIKPDNSDVVMNDLTFVGTDDQEQGRSMDNEFQGFYECFLTSFYSKKFSILLKLLEKIDYSDSFDLNANKEAIIKSGESDGGAGGEFFFITHDKSLIVKTVAEGELEVFKNLIDNYATYFHTNPDSYICKIIGIFEFQFKLTSKRTRVIVMENMFRRRPSLIHRKYDIKGSTFSRCVKYKKEIEDKHTRVTRTLKDIDFINVEKNIELLPEIRQRLLSQINKDVEFFRAHKIIDYSLLLGVIDTNLTTDDDFALMEQLEREGSLIFDHSRKEAYIMGIIDYFQVYNMSKCFEKYYKKISHLNLKLDTSSQPSKYYSTRFLAFLEKIFKK